MSDNEPHYHSYHDAVLNDPKIKKIIQRLKSYPTPTGRHGYQLNHDQWRIGLKNHPVDNYVSTILRRNRADMSSGGWPVTSMMNIAAKGALKDYPGPLRLWHEALLLMEDRMLKGYFLGPFNEERDLPQWLLQGQAPLFHPMFGKYELKSDGSIKTRLLFNLSDDTNGPSFNDCIPDAEKTVHYITLLDVCRRIVDCDMKWLWCLDALEAYYRVRIRCRFIPKMGVRVCKMLFFFTCLVMGQATACRLYTEFADAVVWIIANNEKELFKWRDTTDAGECVEREMIMHYVDDFMGGHRQRRLAELQFAAVKDWWVRLGIPTQDRKCTPPTQVLKYLGFLFNARRRSLSVPPKKILKYSTAVRCILDHYSMPPRDGNVSNTRKMKNRELMKAVGQLRSIQCVYPYIVPALRPLEAVTSRHAPTEWVRVTARMADGLRIVQAALKDIRQQHMPFDWLLHPRDVGDVEIFTDASTTTGVGGFEDHCGGRYFGANWSDTAGWGVYKYQPDITYLELLGVVLAVRLFAAKWRHKVVKLRCDNHAVCMMLRRKAACYRRRDLNALLIEICALATANRLYFWVEHVPGVQNKLADALSRDELAIAAQQIAHKKLAAAATPCLGELNALAETWRRHAKYVVNARFAAKGDCHCDPDDALTRRQCDRLNKPFAHNAHRTDPASLGRKLNRKQRRFAKYGPPTY